MSQRIPDRAELRTLYDEAVNVIARSRPEINLTAGFYAQTGDSVFEAGYISVCDHVNGVRRLNVVSAPSGGGKTSFSFAFIVALTRYAESHADAPAGCVFVVDQIKKADDAYRELNALLPGKVAVWSSDHRRGARDRSRVQNPAAEFDADELRDYPAIIVTHQFFSGSQGDKARLWGVDVFSQRRRALAIVDERPEEVEVYETTTREANSVREFVAQKIPDQTIISEYITRLLILMETYGLYGKNGIVRAEGGESAMELLSWFASDEATNIAKTYAPTIPAIHHLFGLARSIMLGCAFSASEGNVSGFVGWQSKLMIEPGMMLLDATADIDGVSQICPWRTHVKTAQVNYRNLNIIHLPQYTTRNLSTFFEKIGNRQQYADWMVAAIKAYMRPGERELVVCKKSLIDNGQIPNWDGHDPRFADPASYSERYEWDLEGRSLCAIYWGIGIGANSWRDADVVFLFDEFHLPRRVAVATVQGLRRLRANEGDLALMATLSSKAAYVELIAEGHRLRWTKQLALRGRARQCSDDGVCGGQRLVIACDPRSLFANIGRLFPGAGILQADPVKPAVDKATKAAQLIRVLRRPDLPSRISATQVGNFMNVRWREVSTYLLTPELTESLAAIGWRYVSGRGRAGSHFERIEPAKLAA